MMIRILFSISMIVFLGSFTGCAEKQNEVIITEQTPEEIQAKMDAYEKDLAEQASIPSS